MSEKECPLCKVHDIDSKFTEIYGSKLFYRDSSQKDGLSFLCKNCTSKYTTESNRLSYQNKLERYYESIRHKYGLDSVDYNKMIIDQLGLCVICKNELIKPCMDHCHVTGKNRGILCHYCNTGLGMFRDNIDNLDRAIKYLS